MYIKDLPPELRELALMRTRDNCFKSKVSVEEFNRRIEKCDISGLFVFNEYEGSMWYEVCAGKNLERHNEYAKSIVGELSSNYELY